MKIGVNTLFLIPGEVGGSETYLRDILRHAVGRHPELQWVFFTNRENHDLFRREYGDSANVGCSLIPVQARSRVARIVHEQVHLPLAARRTGVDVLWSPGYTAPLWAPCPQVVSVLDMQYCEFPDDLTALARIATGFLVPAAVRVARRVVTLSEFSRDQIVKYTGCPPGKIAPIHLAADRAFGIPVGQGAECRRRGVTDTPYILCVAHTYPHKNVHSLVDAFSAISGQWNGNLVLVGKAQRGEPLVVQALDKVPKPERVIRLQGLERRDLIALYQGASVFVFPSLYEGFGLPVLEAMMAGVPVVTTERGPMRELGGDGVHYCDGTAVGLAKAINTVLGADSGVRSEWVSSARKRAQSFSWEHTADQTLQVLRDSVMGARANS